MRKEDKIVLCTDKEQKSRVESPLLHTYTQFYRTDHGRRLSRGTRPPKKIFCVPKVLKEKGAPFSEGKKINVFIAMTEVFQKLP